MPLAETPGVHLAKLRVISTAPFGDVVEQSGKIQHFRPLEITDELAAKRVFMGELGRHELPQVSHYHQDMLIHRIDVKQVMLHLADDTAERRNVAPQDAIAIHQSQFPRQSARLAQDFHEQGAVAGIAPECRINEWRCPPHCSQRSRTAALQVRMLLQQQNTLQDGARVLAEYVLIAYFQPFAALLETLIDNDRGRILIGKNLGAQREQQYGVDLCYRLRGTIIPLHQHFTGAARRLSGYIELIREGSLIIE